MKVWAPNEGNGDGGAASATTATSAEPAAGSATALGGAPETKPETKTDAAPADGKKPEGEAKPDDKATKAPALVDDKWEPTAVEGVTRDAKELGEFRDLAKKLGFNVEQAKALVEFSDARAKAQLEAAQAHLKDENTGWQKELEGDKDIGGSKLKATTESCRRLIRSLKVGDELATFLEDRGIGNAPVLVRAFAELAARTSEDTIRGTLTEVKPSVDVHQERINRTYGPRKEA